MTSLAIVREALIERGERVLAGDAPSWTDLQWAELLAWAMDAYDALAALDATPGEGDKLRNALEYVREHLLADPCPIGRKHVKRVVDAALWSAAPLSGSVVK